MQFLDGRAVGVVPLGAPQGRGGGCRPVGHGLGLEPERSCKATRAKSGALCACESGTSHPPSRENSPEAEEAPREGEEPASVFSWRPAAPKGPIVPGPWETVGWGWELSETLVGAAICISFYGFIFALFLSLCFPRVAFGVNVSFENFSITRRREGGLPQPCSILMIPKWQSLASHAIPKRKVGKSELQEGWEGPGLLSPF